MHVAYYITGHGYGHGVRSCAVCNEFSNDIRLTIRTNLSRDFLDSEMRREFEYVEEELDCGCIQTDSVTVDIEKTIQRYSEIAEANAGRLGRHVAWARSENVDVIVCDITPFACEVAHNAGVTSVVVSNFSWVDIYEPYAETSSRFRPIVEQMKQQYALADLLLALEPPNALNGFRRREDMPVVGRTGTARPDDIRRHFGIGRQKKIAVIYVGPFGLDTVAWPHIERFRDWEFIGLHPLPVQPKNFHTAPKGFLPYEDLCASADCIISKLGYGVYSECIVNGVPLVFCPRNDFAEYPVLEQSILSWGHAYRLSLDKFINVEWDDALNRIAGTSAPEPVRTNAAYRCARRIEQAAQNSRNARA